MKLKTTKTTMIKSLLSVLLLLLLIAGNSFSAPPLPFTDNFEVSGDDPAAVWIWEDADNSKEFDDYSEPFRQTLDRVEDGVLVIEAYGNPTWLSEDEYASRFLDNVSGDFTVIVQVKEQGDSGSTGEQCGIIVRNDITREGEPNNEGYVTLAVVESGGYAMSIDRDDDGALGTSKISGTSEPPETWLKLTKNGSTFTGSTSVDGLTWVEFATTDGLNKGLPISDVNLIQDVGLFVYAKHDSEKSIVKFDNFSIVGGLDSYKWSEDNDEDTFGNNNSTVETKTNVKPAGKYVAYDPENHDCDDSNDEIYPGATEKCNGLDDDCDGEPDEDLVGTNTYYQDEDEDGYGTSVSRSGCTLPDKYAEKSGDCNDADPGINPGIPDKCGDGIDQDCNGADSSCDSGDICLEIADSPLSAQVKSAPAVVMFLLDDSGSMAWDVLCPEQGGRFSGKSWVSSKPNYWQVQAVEYNGIFYDPNKVYEPWVLYGPADKDTPSKHPVGNTDGASFTTDTQNLSSTFKTLYGVSIPYARYYIKSINKTVYLVTIKDSSIKYYEVDVTSGQVKGLNETTSPPDDVKLTDDYDVVRKNFANWFQYYRTRELAAKAALGMVIDEIENMHVGIHTINKSVKLSVQAIKIDGLTDKTDYLIRQLYQVKATGGTPLRLGLQDVGQYFDTEDTETLIGVSPYALDTIEDGVTTEHGGACQQAFCIALTDGYYNGKPTGIGDADGDKNTLYDQDPFASKGPETLADVAMDFYERDLAPGLDDKLYASDIDPALHQHMVTYMVSFGLEGNLTPNDTCPSVEEDCPTWPNPSNDAQKIDDLWHTAVNGRGLFLTARNTDELVGALTTLMSDIDKRTKTSAPVSLNTQKLESDTDLYQGEYESVHWSGDLLAYDVCTADDVTADIDICPEVGDVKHDPSWSAKEQLDLDPTAVPADTDFLDWDSGRQIISLKGSSTIKFRYDALSDDQKEILDSDPAVAEKLLNYIRGDHSEEVKNDGILRDRISMLGDIVHSSPVYENGIVYVGANDGMLHAFNAVTGVEEFAFVPSRVIENLYQYADINYAHKYFVDGKITTAVIGSETLLIGSLGKGGRSIFGIDITDAKDITESNLPTAWEYPVPGTGDDDMGFSYSTVSVVNSNLDKPVIIFGNGYDSKSGTAALYILDIDGTLLRRIDTGVGDDSTMCNGLSSPALTDVNNDGKVDYAYAGDLQGNMWKFDLTVTSSALDWTITNKDGSDFKPLFQAKNKDGEVQAITGRPDVMRHCDTNKKGYIVVFGTGKYISFADITSLETQSIYGIWDWEDSWSVEGVDSTDKYFGYHAEPSGDPAVRNLSNLDTLDYFPDGKDLILLEQTQITMADGWRTTTNNPINWFSPKELIDIKAKATATGDGEEEYTYGLHVGWYFDLPSANERVIAKTQIRDGKAIVVSISPSDKPCASGGSSVVHVINACNGGMLDEAQFDTDGDGDVDKKDDSKTGKEFEDDIYYAPAILEDTMYFSKDEIHDTSKLTKGLHYWRMFKDN